ncbi:TonB family protein [Hyphomicrobium facile]|uniref:Protein TonB n=1 Tax=Hyphomicrobium facile TaxID=51670 RepID=A0A1I7N073_9HYPH|nr:TonB family protein [Hyphomicrobium facile]SFV28069.1 protein TonB [Hyphomicrobium facile]
MSVLIHASIGSLMLASSRKSIADALDLGQGIDVVLVEQGIATEGLVKLGDAMQTIEPAQILPPQPPPQPDEVKPDELRNVIASDASSVEAIVGETQERPAPPQPDVAQAKEQQPPQAAVSTEQSSGPAKTGADAKAVGLYLGQIQKHVERAKVSPPSRRSGAVVMRFVIGLDGKLLSREVVSGSGFKILDDAAAAALDRAAPFPPIPPKVSLSPITLTQQFTFEAMLVKGKPPRSRRE